mgnify:CR=1 FL=1
MDGESVLAACPRCGDLEHRHDGYCSVYCRDLHGEEVAVHQLQAVRDGLATALGNANCEVRDARESAAAWKKSFRQAQAEAKHLREAVAYYRLVASAGQGSSLEAIEQAYEALLAAAGIRE